MNVKLKDPTKVYYCKEQKLSFAGKKNIETKVTQHVRGLINDGSLVEVREEKISAEAKAAIIAEAKAEEAKVKEADEAKVKEAERVAKLTPAELKKEKAEALAKAKEIEKA